MIRNIVIILILMVATCPIFSQSIKGKVVDGSTGDGLIGASVTIKGTTEGNVTDYDGFFEIKTSASFPMVIVVSYLGYDDVERTIDKEGKNITIVMRESGVIVDVVEVKASRISEETKKSPLTIEALDNIAIKETPSSDFYSGLGSLKGVDLTAASLGFKVVNTRGFNSTSPVRSLQIIDGVDNQAPGLNFSLGNFLGSSELDVNKVEIIVGASSAFYGPNAFNGVISMETKNPFYHHGLSASIKGGERNLLQTAVRWADVIKNKKGQDFFAYKLNMEYLRADDWVADNYDPVDGLKSRNGKPVSKNNPGGYDAVNIYGDEYQSRNDFTDFPLYTNTGLGVWFRPGYKEIDLVDYNTRNYKANASLHFKTKPGKDFESPEVVISSSFGGGTTVYQGDNRFSLKGITFLQNKLEYHKTNKFFVRAYMTTTTAGKSYDPYFTALQLLKNGRSDPDWSTAYHSYWLENVIPRIQDSDFPKLEITGYDPETGLPIFDFDVDAAEKWLSDHNDLLTQWHKETANAANSKGVGGDNSPGYFAPGTPEFEEEFNRITSSLRSEGGTRFYDKSSLYHIHGEYKFAPSWTDELTLGANGRIYTPKSKGTVFSDLDSTIVNREIGVYAGITKSIVSNKLKFQGAIRLDKNENFDPLISPAASLVYTPTEKDFFRLSFSSAIRNPTLSDQYLSLNVGRAILAGNLHGATGLVTIPSLKQYFSTRMKDDLEYFDIDAIQPEKVKTLEAGVRTTLFDKVYLDAGYYYSIYDNFIGYKIGADVDIDFSVGALRDIQVYRYAANSDNTVTTQGLAIGLNYYFASRFSLQGNYSWNRLNTEIEDDPIIPAFNTPEHKFNIGINGRDFSLFGINHLGFNVNYKWIQGFLFEGSPQFTGFIPTYDMLDAQVNVRVPSLHMTFKAGASNVLNNLRFQTYGGPRIGRLAYFQITYDMNKK